MEQVGVNYVQNVQQPSFQGKQEVTHAPVGNPIEQKEDGDKKLMSALIGLGATAAAGIYIAKGKGKVPTAIRNKISKLFHKGAQEAAEKANSTVSRSALKNAGIASGQDGKWVKNDAGQFVFGDGRIVGQGKPFRVESQNGKGWIEYVDGKISQACDGNTIKKYRAGKTQIFDLDGKTLLRTIEKGDDGKVTRIYEHANGQPKTLVKSIEHSGNTTTIKSNFSGTGKNRVANHVETITDTSGKKIKGKGVEVTRSIETIDLKDGVETKSKAEKSFFNKQ